MLFKNIQLRPLLEFPEFPAEIISRSNAGTDRETLVYKFYALVDLDTAVEVDSLNLEVTLHKKKPVSDAVPKKVRRARSWSRSTKRLERNVQKKRALRINRSLAKKRIDLTSYLSNDLARKRARIQARTRQEENSILARKVTVKLQDPFTFNRAVSVKPSISGVVNPAGIAKQKAGSKPMSSTVVQGIRIVPPSPPKFSKAVLSIKKDPAKISAVFLKPQSNRRTNTLPTAVKMKVADVVFTPPRSLPIMNVYNVFPKKQLISFKLRIRRSTLASLGSFYLDLELENSKGIKVAEEGVQIPHAMILNAFLTPRHAPTLEAEYIKPGIVSVSLEKHKRDRMSTRMKVFRRLTPIDEGTTNEGTPWVEIFDESSKENGTFVFRDTIATSNAVVYRAVGYGENFKPSEKFASTVVMPLKQFRVKQHGSLTAVPSLITTSDSISSEVIIKDIPDDVISVMLRRFNKTTNSDADRMASKGKGFEYVGTTPEDQVVFVRDIGEEGSAVFTDRSIKSGNNYVYVPVGLTRAGKQISGSSAALEVPLSPGSPQVSLRVSDPKVNTRTGIIAIELSGKFTEFGFSEIRSSLASAQQAELFTNDLLEDRDKFESLINFLVERENSKTGEVESFGVYEAGTFKDDNSTREEKNIKDLEPGVEYTYTVTALLNSPETLFPSLVRKEVDTRSLLPFSRKIAKFRNSLALSKATLASTQRQVTPSTPSPIEPNDPLIAGRTNVQLSKTVRAPVGLRNKPTIRVEKHKRFNRIVWNSEDVDRVDHFKIYVLASGGRVLVDTVHCDDSSSEFYYRHYDKDYALEYQYLVQPVSLGYKNLKPILTRKMKPLRLSKTLGARFGSKVVKK